MITSVLDKAAGFYSILFFTINHYLYCKKHNISFHLDSNNWLFKSVNGWTDYFLPIDFEGENKEHEDKVMKHNELADNFNMYEYQSCIRNNFYLYNDKVKKEIEETKERLGLNKKDYDAIFIRRGDKICYETKIIDTEVYIKKLLEINPNCKTIFVQTDDYNCFLEIKKYMEDNQLDIEVITLCHPDVKGMVVFDKDLSVELHNCVIRGHQANKDYFDKISPDLKKFTPVDKMDSEQLYKHTIEMLVGVDIVLHSKHCTLDYQSNVGRFICVAHYDNKNVIDVRFNECIQMYWTMCPAYW
jgi:hypothetical protein